MNKTSSSARTIHQRGAALSVTITIVTLVIVAIIASGLAIMAYVNYLDQKNNVDAKIDSAVATSEKNLADDLETKFSQREKEPNRNFSGPSDYGTLGFKYPKTWSEYVANDGQSGNGYEAYFSPVSVPSLDSKTSRYALSVVISVKKYETVIAGYQTRVEKGDLKTSPTKANGQNGTRLDGKFTEDIRGSAVVYKIRDKTAIISTEADTFKPDFEALIQTITFVE